jgi:hypothetical protein
MNILSIGVTESFCILVGKSTILGKLNMANKVSSWFFFVLFIS